MQESVVNCPNCQEIIPEASAACPFCKMEFFSCSSCNGIVIKDDKVCPNCREVFDDEIIVRSESTEDSHQIKIRTHKIEGIVNDDLSIPVFPDKCVYCCENVFDYIHLNLESNFPLHRSKFNYKKTVKIRDRLKEKLKIDFDLHISRNPTGKDLWQICIKPVLQLKVPFCSEHFSIVKDSIIIRRKENTQQYRDSGDFWPSFIDGCGCFIDLMGAVTLVLIGLTIYFIINAEGVELLIIIAIAVGAITWGASKKIQYSSKYVLKNFPRGYSFSTKQLLGFKASFFQSSKPPLRIKAIFEFINKEYSELFLDANKGFYRADNNSTDLLSNKNISNKE